MAEVRSAVRAALVDRRVLVACSGGADSLALAAAVAFEAPRRGVSAALATVDHGLQAGSDERARAVAGIGYELGFDPVFVLPVTVGTGGGYEAAARSARYAALLAAAEGDVLLGHTLDDQAESVLLGLGRGSGPRSVAGMRLRDGDLVRPLLGVRRSTTVAACAALGLPVWDDPDNVDTRFQRARLRHEVLPLLEDVLQGGVAEALARTASLLQEDLDALDALAASAPAGLPRELSISGPDRLRTRGNTVEAGLDVGELLALPRALRTRVLRTWALELGATECTAVHTAALDALVTSWHGQGPIDLPGGVRVARASGRLIDVTAS